MAAIGDRVLVKRLGLKEIGKLTDKWENVVYVIVSRSRDLPVYTVRREDNEGPVRTLHRNLLLPIGYVSHPDKRTVDQPLRKTFPKSCKQSCDPVGVEDFPLPEISVTPHLVDVGKIGPISPSDPKSPLTSPVKMDLDIPSPDPLFPLDDLPQDTERKDHYISDVLDSTEDNSSNQTVVLDQVEDRPLRRSSRPRKPLVKESMCAVVTGMDGNNSLISGVNALVDKLLDKSHSQERLDTVVSCLDKIF